MGTAFSDYAEIKILDRVLRNQAFALPTPYIALHTADPTDAGTGAEVSGGSYARQTIAFGAAASRAASNSGLITFPVATASWGTVTHFGIWDALTVGNLLMYGALTASKVVGIGNQLTFAIGEIDMSVDVGKMTDYLANKVLDHVLGTAAYTSVATVYASLHTTATTDAGGGTEVTGGSYARKSITFAAAAAGATSNSSEEAFIQATANWGDCSHGAIWDASTVGNMLFHGALVATQTVNSGDQFKYAAGALDISLT